MRNFFAAVFIAFLGTAWPGASQEPQQKTEPPFAAEFAKIKSAMETVQKDTVKAFDDAKTEEEKKAAAVKMTEVLNRQAILLVEKAFELIAPHAKDPAAVEVFVWIMETRPASAPANKAADLLIEYHLTNPKTQEIAARYVYSSMPWTAKLLRALAGADLPAGKKGRVLLQLARCLQGDADFVPALKKFNARKTKTTELTFGKEYIDRLRNADTAKLEAEAVKLYTEVIEKYGDEDYGRKKLRDAAKSAIYEIMNLSIGKTAPEITGEDIDGKAMKLSDYRGKVVVLDYWGHW